MECKRRDLAILAAVAVAFFLYFNLRDLHRRSPDYELYKQVAAVRDGPPIEDLFDDGLANETLGFGAIIAVSKQGSKRRQGMLDAANLTDIEIVIPEQPKWTEADVNTVKDKGNSIISKGSAMAWLGHMNAVQWFLDSNHTTALIIEDDVDWDLHIRHYQAPLVASNLRSLLSTNPTQKPDAYSTLRSHNRAPSYWGDLTQWEILYLGHCGDNFDLKYWDDLPHHIFPDATVPDMEHLHPDTRKWMQDAGIAAHQRMLHRSKNPLCSFAYAINRASATRLLAELSHEEKDHGSWAFDVRLLEACRDLDWKCWTANPELFHHQDEHDSSITEINGKPLFELHEQWGDGSTPNIGCGARHSMWKTGELERVRMVAMDVGACSVEEVEDKIEEEAEAKVERKT